MLWITPEMFVMKIIFFLNKSIEFVSKIPPAVLLFIILQTCCDFTPVIK